MRIAMIGQKGLPATYGGIEKHVEEISERLVARNHEVTVYSRYHYSNRRGMYKGVRIIALPSLNTKHLDTATHCLLSTVDSLFRRYDVVHFHALGPSVFAAGPRLRGVKTIVTVHGLDWEREKWGPMTSWFLKRCEYPALHFPNETIVVSKTLQQYFKEKYSLSAVVIPNGTLMPEPRAANRIAKLGLAGSRYILFVGRLVPEKGCHFLLEAYRQIDTDAKLVLAGGGSHSDDYVMQLRGLADERVLLPGFVTGELLQELWSNAYIIAQPSTIEGLSISLLEALSYGNCVLISDIPENVEVSGDCAVTFRSKDVADLKEKLQMLLNNEEMVRDYRKRAKQCVRERYDWEKVVDSTEQLYESVRDS